MTEDRMGVPMSLSSAEKQCVRAGVGAAWEAEIFRESPEPICVEKTLAPNPDIALRLAQPLSLLPRALLSWSGVTLRWHQLHAVRAPPHSEFLVPSFLQPLWGVCGWSLLGRVSKRV